jgi:hypothetical protein
MTQPASPTRLKRKAIFARAVPRRKSLAMATIAPARAHTPSMPTRPPAAAFCWGPAAAAEEGYNGSR